MNYLVDTDWVIDYLKGKSRARTLLASLAPDSLALSLLSYGEIYEGIYFGRDPKQHTQDFFQFLRWVPVLSINKPIVKRFAQLRGQLRQSGSIIGDFDILIAATALHYELTLITQNRRHFSRIPALKLY